MLQSFSKTLIKKKLIKQYFILTQKSMLLFSFHYRIFLGCKVADIENASTNISSARVARDTVVKYTCDMYSKADEGDDVFECRVGKFIPNFNSNPLTCTSSVLYS